MTSTIKKYLAIFTMKLEINGVPLKHVFVATEIQYFDN